MFKLLTQYGGKQYTVPGGDMIKERIVSKLKQARGITMKEKILQTSEAYFCETGYLTATIRNLAGAAGISVGSFYFYFRDKEEVLLEVYRRQSERFLTAIHNAVGRNDLYRTDRRKWLGFYISSLLDAYGNSGKLRAELKAVTWKVQRIAEEKNLVKQQTVSSIREILDSSEMINDVRVKHKDIALLFVIDMIDCTYERIFYAGSPDEKKAAAEECTDAIYRYLFQDA